MIDRINIHYYTLYNSGCLCSWLEQDFSCPTCRRPLSGDIGIPQAAQAQQADANGGNNDDFEEIAAENQNAGGEGGGLRNYFFYLDGQQIANWFPSFSIEVFHGRMEQQNEEEINEMVSICFLNQLKFKISFCYSTEYNWKKMIVDGSVFLKAFYSKNNELIDLQ